MRLTFLHNHDEASSHALICCNPNVNKRFRQATVVDCLKWDGTKLTANRAKRHIDSDGDVRTKIDTRFF